MLIVATAAFLPRLARATEVRVPLEIQVKLLTKVAAYDKYLAERAGSKVRIAVLETGDERSQYVAGRLAGLLGEVERIDGLPVSVSRARFESASALAGRVREERLSIVYLSTGFEDHEEAIAAALSGVDVLSVAPAADDVQRRIVLGFDLVGGKPKLFCHLAQAKAQHVAFSASVLKLMRIVE